MKILMITHGGPVAGKPRTTYFLKRQADFLTAAGADLEVFNFDGRQDPRRYARAWMQVQSRVFSGRYDLVHAQFGQSGLLALPKRLPLVVTLPTMRRLSALTVVKVTGGASWAAR